MPGRGEQAPSEDRLLAERCSAGFPNRMSSSRSSCGINHQTLIPAIPRLRVSSPRGFGGALLCVLQRFHGLGSCLRSGRRCQSWPGRQCGRARPLRSLRLWGPRSRHYFCAPRRRLARARSPACLRKPGITRAANNGASHLGHSQRGGEARPRWCHNRAQKEQFGAQTVIHQT